VADNRDLDARRFSVAQQTDANPNANPGKTIRMPFPDMKQKL